MSEPDWVYRQRRVRAMVALAMAIGAIVMVVVVGSSLSKGIDLDGPTPVAIKKPNTDEILAREQRQIEAQKGRKAARRQPRTGRGERREAPKKKHKSGGGSRVSGGGSRVWGGGAASPAA